MKTETDTIRALRKENQRLKTALAKAILTKKELESLVKVVNELFYLHI
jgi:hypothetical protein